MINKDAFKIFFPVHARSYAGWDASYIRPAFPLRELLIMPDPLASPKRRLARAKEHISNLETGAKAFFDKKPTAMRTEQDAQRDNIVKIVLTEPFPDSLTKFAVEAVEGLRSALDQTGYAIGVANGAADPRASISRLLTTRPASKTLSKGDAKISIPESSRFSVPLSLTKEGMMPFGP